MVNYCIDKIHNKSVIKKKVLIEIKDSLKNVFNIFYS